MKKAKRLFTIYIFMSFFAGCQDFFVPSLNNEIIVLLSPPDQMYTTDPTICFWWEEVSNAEKYNLQVVSPDFDSIVKILADTNLTNNKFENLILYPGEFEWRVKALNTQSETIYSSACFYIDSTENVYDVLLVQPLNNTYTNKTSVFFEWKVQDLADFYRFKLVKDGSTLLDENLQQNSLTVPDDLLSITNIPEGIFSWMVQAINDNSQSAFTSNNLTIDRTIPGKPILQSPPEDTLDTNEPVLIWQRPEESGSPISDSLFIYKDTLNSNPYIEIKLSTSEYNLPSENNGKFYWKVKSIDAAQNESDFSSPRWFVIQVKNNKCR